MATPQEIARQKIISQYGSRSAANDAAKRIKAGQYTASDTLNFANATGIPDAVARSVAKPTVITDPNAAVPPATPPVVTAPPVPTLVPVATSTNPVVDRPGVGATSTPATYPDMGTGSPEADKFLAISSKNPADVTEEDRAYLRQINAKAALMGGINNALGISGSTYNGSRVEATDTGFTMYDANGTARQATLAETEALRRSSIGQNAVKVYQDTKLIADQKTAQEKALAAETARRDDANKKNMSAYEQLLRANTDKSIATLREQGQKRKDALQGQFSAQGGGRSTDAMRGLDEVQKSIDDQVKLEEAKYSAQTQAYLLEQQGADSEALKPYRDQISKLDAELGKSQATAFKRMQELNQAGNATAEQALQNLMSTLTTQAKSELGMAGFDEAESVKLGYFARKDKNGAVSPILGKDGKPIQFKTVAKEAEKIQAPVKIGEDAKGRDIMGVYNPTTKKYEPLAYGVGASATGGASGTGVGGGLRSMVGGVASAPAQLSTAQRAQIDALKGEYFTDKSRDTLANAGVSQSQLDAYVTESEVGPEMALKVGQVLTVIPVQLRNSTEEQKNYQKQAVLLLKQGKDIVAAQRALLGQVLPENVTDEQKDALRGALSYIDQLPGESQTAVVRAMKNGDVATAIKSMESAYMKEKSDGNVKFREGTTLNAVRSANELEALSKKFEGKYGPISGRWEALKTKFKNNPEAQALLSRMTVLTSKMRNELSGTAVTSSEGVVLDPIIVTLNDPQGNVVEKLAALRDAAINGYNAEREAVGLPRLDEKALLSGKERVKAYVASARGEEYVPSETNQVLSGNVAGSGKTYKITDINGATESVSGEEFAKQMNDQLNAAGSLEAKAEVIKNAKAYAAAAGIPAEVYDPLGVF